MLEIIAAVADLVSATCKALIKYRNSHVKFVETNLSGKIEKPKRGKSK